LSAQTYLVVEKRTEEGSQRKSVEKRSRERLTKNRLVEIVLDWIVKIKQLTTSTSLIYYYPWTILLLFPPVPNAPDFTGFITSMNQVECSIDNENDYLEFYAKFYVESRVAGIFECSP